MITVTIVCSINPKFSKSLESIQEFVTWDLTRGWTRPLMGWTNSPTTRKFHENVHTMSCVYARKVRFHCPRCNDFAANIVNTNLLKKLQIHLFSPSSYFKLEGVARVGRLKNCGLGHWSSPTSRPAQRKIHGAWARSNLSNLRNLTILSKEPVLWKNTWNIKQQKWFKSTAQHST